MSQSDWLMLRITHQSLEMDDSKVDTQKSWYIYTENKIQLDSIL